METISIHKKQEQHTTFNVHQYQKFLEQQYPAISEILHRDAAEKMGKMFAKLREFNTETDANTIIRNIIKQGDVYAEFSENFTKNQNVIQSEVIILGKKHNWAKYSDVVITKFNNYKYNYPREVLDDHKKLLAAQFQTYRVRNLLEHIGTRQEYPDFIVSEIPKRSYEDDILINPASLGPIADYVKSMFGASLDVHNFHGLFVQLKSIGMATALYGDPKDIPKMVSKRIGDEIANFGRIKLAQAKMDERSELNLLQKILIKEYDTESPIMKLFVSKKITSVAQFYEIAPKKDVEKIKKIIGTRSAEVYEPPCIHTGLVRQFISGYRGLREQVIELCDIDKNTMQYHCSKCSRRAFCQHNLDMSGVPPEKKMSVVSKYKNQEISTRTIYYCKYCNEKIYKNETEYVLNGADFMAMSKVRESALSKETNIDTFDSGLYNGINTALSCFKIGYEFNQQVLARSVKLALYGSVYEQISRQNAENDSQFELITKMYAFIFTLVYMRTLFMKDPKVTTKSGIRKQDSAYGQFITQEVETRFKGLASREKTINIIKIAAVKIKENKTNVKIYAKTEKDNVMEIVQSKRFSILYHYYNYGNHGTDALTVFQRLVKTQKPTLATFYEGIAMPTKNVNDHERNIYTHLFDYSSPYCYIYNFTENETIGNLPVNFPKYSPKLYNEILAEYQKNVEEVRAKAYRDVVSSDKDFPFRYSYGPNFMYDDEGNIIDWVPMGPGKPWEYTSPSGKRYELSKIKKAIDKSTEAKIIARNSKLKFTKANFVPAKKQKAVQHASGNTGDKFEFNKKLVTNVTGLDSKFTANMVNYLGRTEGYDYQNLMKGIIPDVESYNIGQIKVNSYIHALLRHYYCLKNVPLSAENTNFFEKNNIDFIKSKQLIANLPDLEFSKYFGAYKENISSWDPKKFYLWNLESLLEFASQIIKTGDLGAKICLTYFENIFAEDRKNSMPDEKKVLLVGNDNLNEAEYVEEFSKKPTALDIIDFEEDEDDMNDSD